MRRLARTLLSAATLLTATAAHADETLRLADSLPVGHFLAGSGTTLVMDRVKDLTAGKARDLLSPRASEATAWEWAAALDRRGEAGTRVLAAFRDVLARRP